MQASKLVNDIGLDKEKSTKANEEYLLSSESQSDKITDYDSDKSVYIYKIIDVDDETELCKTSVKSKNTRIVKSKQITLTIQRLQESHTDLWKLYNPFSFSSRN